MENENMKNYKGFNKGLTKEDLNKEESEYYDKIMSGIKESSQEEKEEVARLMNICIVTDEKPYTSCVRCGEEFINGNTDLIPDGKRVYCNDCLRKMWSPSAIAED